MFNIFLWFLSVFAHSVPALRLFRFRKAGYKGQFVPLRRFFFLLLSLNFRKKLKARDLLCNTRGDVFLFLLSLESPPASKVQHNRLAPYAKITTFCWQCGFFITEIQEAGAKLHPKAAITLFGIPVMIAGSGCKCRGCRGCRPARGRAANVSRGV